MAVGPNATNKSDSDFYAIGKGCLMYAEVDATDNPLGYRELGNAPDFSATINQEDLEHRDSKSGVSEIDRTITLTRDIQGSFTLEEINDENLADLLGGTQSVLTNPAVAGFTNNSWIANADLESRKYYELKDSNGVRAYNVQSANITIEHGVGPTTLVLGTDYEVKEKEGLIYFLNSAAVIALIGGSDDVDLTLAADGAAGDVDQVEALEVSEVVGALKFLRVDPATDKIQEWQFHKVKLSANGDAALISDNALISLPFSFAAQKTDAGDNAGKTLTISTPQDQ